MSDARSSTPSAVPHGMPPGFKSPSGYVNHGCRCEECRRAYLDYMREWRAAHPGWRDDYLRNRSMVWVRCVDCDWTSRREETRGWDVVEEKPCPKCGGQVVV